VHAPVIGSHAAPSSVQTFPSSQLFGTPTHVPVAHVSPVVHALPSSHAALGSGVKTHPVAEAHEFAVHESLSSHTRGTCPHALFVQESTVQASLSSQFMSLAHPTHTPLSLQKPPAQVIPTFGAGSCTGMLPLQLSVVHEFASLVGTSALSATIAVPPFPSHVTFWQSFAVCMFAGASPAGAPFVVHFPVAHTGS
jgi:hypothetical protein